MKSFLNEWGYNMKENVRGFKRDVVKHGPTLTAMQVPVVREYLYLSKNRPKLSKKEMAAYSAIDLGFVAAYAAMNPVMGLAINGWAGCFVYSKHHGMFKE